MNLGPSDNARVKYEKIKAYIVFREMCVADPVFADAFMQIWKELAGSESYTFEKKELEEIYRLRVIFNQQEGKISSSFALEVATSRAYLAYVRGEGWQSDVEEHMKRFSKNFSECKETEFMFVSEVEAS